MAVMAQYKGENFDPENGNFEIINYRDIYIFNLKTKQPRKITTGKHIDYSPTFSDSNNLLFLQTDRTVENEITQRILQHSLDSDKTKIIFEKRYVLVDNRIKDDNFNRIKARQGINKILALSRHHNDGNPTFGFDILDFNGNILLNGHEIATFERVITLEWIDANRIAILNLEEGLRHINVINLKEKSSTRIFTAPEEVENINGLNVSPNGKYLISHVWMKEGGNRNLLIRL